MMYRTILTIKILFGSFLVFCQVQDCETVDDGLYDSDIYNKAMLDIISNSLGEQDSAIVIEVDQTYMNITKQYGHCWNPDFPIDSNLVSKRLNELKKSRPNDSIVFYSRMDTLYFVRDSTKFKNFRSDCIEVKYSKNHSRIRIVKSKYFIGIFEYDKLNGRLQRIEFKFKKKYPLYEGTIGVVEFEYRNQQLDRIRLYDYYSPNTFEMYIIEYYKAHNKM